MTRQLFLSCKEINKFLSSKEIMDFVLFFIYGLCAIDYLRYWLHHDPKFLCNGKLFLIFTPTGSKISVKWEIVSQRMFYQLKMDRVVHIQDSWYQEKVRREEVKEEENHQRRQRKRHVGRGCGLMIGVEGERRCMGEREKERECCEMKKRRLSIKTGDNQKNGLVLSKNICNILVFNKKKKRPVHVVR